MDVTVRTRGLAGGFAGASVATNLGGKPWICMPWQVCDQDARAQYVREQYLGLYGSAPPLELLQRVLGSEDYDKDAIYRTLVNSPPPGAQLTPPQQGAVGGSTGPVTSRDTVITPNAFPSGSAPVPGSSNVVSPGGVQLRGNAPPPAGSVDVGGGMVRTPVGVFLKPDASGQWAVVKGPLGLPPILYGVPTTTLLGGAAALAIAVAVALAYSKKKKRSR